MSVAIFIYSVLFLLSAILGIYRVISGPHHLDRILALDYLSVVGIAVALLLVLKTDELLVLDIGLCLALVGFLTAYVYAQFSPKE